MHILCLLVLWQNYIYFTNIFACGCRGVDTILELGGLSQRWGEDQECARANVLDHTHQYVNTPTYRAYLL